MSKRPTSSRRLESRAERQARRPGATPPTSRERSRQPQRVGGGGGFMNMSPMTMLAVGGVLVLVVALIYAVTQSSKEPGDPAWVRAEVDKSTSLPGTYINPDPGPNGKFDGAEVGDDRTHVSNIIPICSQAVIDADMKVEDPYASRPDVANCYNSNPPTSGNHNPNPMPFKVLDNPAPKENLVHNMEHGGVVVWYNSTDAATIKKLADLVTGEINKGHFVVMTQYTDMEPETIALTSWTRLDKFAVSAYDESRIKKFISEHDRRFNPEGF